MSPPAVLIASAKLRPGEGQAFDGWQARHNTVIGKFPGFISSDVIPPSQPQGNEWTMIMNFRSQDELTAWQRSPCQGTVTAVVDSLSDTLPGQMETQNV